MSQATQALRAHSDDPDLILLRAVAAGDCSALQALYERHGRQVLAYLVGKVGERMVADELLQDVQLNSEQREALELGFYHGLTGAEAARVMGVREGTIKSRLGRQQGAHVGGGRGQLCDRRQGSVS
ncbi:MAG: hypothetical protein FJZ90_11475, partial [Chloroflexi bacterium]|nr:hypothetical protein [Chloroflexota bacterium]